MAEPNITQEVFFEMLEKLPDGSFRIKFPKVKSKSGVTFDEHLETISQVPAPNKILKAKNDGYIDNDWLYLLAYPSNTVRAVANSYQDGNETVWTKKKEISCPVKGVVRLDVEGRCETTTSAYTDLGFYVNGSMKTSVRINKENPTYTKFSVDVAVNKGDLIQLYVKSSSSSAMYYIRAFRIMYDIAPDAPASTVIIP